MPYKNILWIKLEKRLLNDHRFYLMSEKAQLIFVKLLMLAAETQNKLPKNPQILKQCLRTSMTEQELKGCVNEIKKSFPKFKKSRTNYYFGEWKNRVNWIDKKGNTKEQPRNSQGTPKVGADKIREDKIREDKKNDGVEQVNAKDNTKLLANYYLKLKGWDHQEPDFYKQNGISYSRQLRAAKDILELADGNLQVAKENLDKVKSWAAGNGLEWALETVTKKWLELDSLKV